MIVDDHPVARRVLLDVLSSLGCSVIAAEDGRSALEIAEDPEECFDWVLLDRQMPGIDGLATAAALRGRCATRGAQLALLVNESGGTHPEQGLVDTVLVRPAGIDALRDALSALLCASSPAALKRAAAGSAGARSASARSADASTADADLQRLRDETLIEDLDGLSSAFEQNDLQSADAHLHRMQGALRICPEPRRCAAILDLQERLAAHDQAGTRVSIQCLGELLAREAFRGADPA